MPLFKTTQIVRGCGARRRVPMEMSYSDKLIDGSPKLPTSAGPIWRWGAADGVMQQCAGFIQ